VGVSGWTVMPRATVWLCVPALLMGAGLSLMLATESLAAGRADPLCDSLREAAAAVTIVWALPSLALTPVAWILACVIWRKRKWTTTVVVTVWVIVVVSGALIVPAANVALRNYRYAVPRPAEAPQAGGAGEAYRSRPPGRMVTRERRRSRRPEGLAHVGRPLLVG
jgi:hypothetical protein